MAHHHHHHHLKRLQHVNDRHESHSSSISNFIHSIDRAMNIFRSVGPGPHRALRGGGGGRFRDRFSGSLPKRTINYDLAESFMDHSTNPLSSDLYKIRFKHSAKQWPNGRFCNYKEKLDKSDGIIIPVTCTQTFPIVAKRKKIVEQLDEPSSSSIVIIDPIVQEQKKKLAEKQTNFYANFFGSNKTSQFSDALQTNKSILP